MLLCLTLVLVSSASPSPSPSQNVSSSSKESGRQERKVGGSKSWCSNVTHQHQKLTIIPELLQNNRLSEDMKIAESAQRGVFVEHPVFSNSPLLSPHHASSPLLTPTSHHPSVLLQHPRVPPPPPHPLLLTPVPFHPEHLPTIGPPTPHPGHIYHAKPFTLKPKFLPVNPTNPANLPQHPPMEITPRIRPLTSRQEYPN